MLKILLFLFTLLSFTTVGQNNKWVEPARIDTIVKFSQAVSVKLTSHKPLELDEYYLANPIYDSLTAPHDNFYNKALAIEKFQIRKLPGQVKRKGGDLFLKLTNDKWFILKNELEKKEVWYTFEYFFKETGFYSIRVQYAEGNDFILVNTHSGEISYLIGRPYFSLDGTLLVALGNDIEAGYNENGFQLLRNAKGKITKLGHYDPKTWGCKSAYWLNNKTLILKNESIKFVGDETYYFDFFTKLEIK